MPKINYLVILKKSWHVTWQNKKLWWFGFFVALTSTGSSFSWPDKQAEKTEKFNQQFLDFFAAHQSLAVTLMAIFLVIFLVLLVMRFLSRAALIESVEKISRSQLTPGGISFQKGISGAKKYFWRLLFISLLIQIAVGIIFALIAAPIAFLFTTKSYIFGVLLTLVGIAIMIPLFALAFFLGNFGSIYAVLGNLSIFNSIEQAYGLFRKNIGSSVVMALICIPISIALFLAAIFAFIFLAVIFLITGLIFYFILGKIGAGIILALAVLACMIICLAIRSAYETFYQSVWIFFFHEIASPKVAEAVIESEKEIEPAAAATPDAA